jgi:hypothetical protein
LFFDLSSDLLQFGIYYLETEFGIYYLETEFGIYYLETEFGRNVFALEFLALIVNQSSAHTLRQDDKV